MKRYVAKKKPQEWYKTIDKAKLDLIKCPKLLLPDMKKCKKIVLDPGKFYPHHNVYYITDSDFNFLKVLGAFLMSNFVEKQLSEISVSMRGGYVRWQCQNLKKIRIPKLQSLSNEDKLNLTKLFDSTNLNKINEKVSQIVNLQK